MVEPAAKKQRVEKRLPGAVLPKAWVTATGAATEETIAATSSTCTSAVPVPSSSSSSSSRSNSTSSRVKTAKARSTGSVTTAGPTAGPLSVRQIKELQDNITALSVQAVRQIHFNSSMDNNTGKYVIRSSKEVSVPIPSFAAAAQLLCNLQPLRYDATTSRSFSFTAHQLPVLSQLNEADNNDLHKLLPNFPKIVKKCIDDSAVYAILNDNRAPRRVYSFTDALVDHAKIKVTAGAICIVYKCRKLDGVALEDGEPMGPLSAQRYAFEVSTDIPGHNPFIL